MQKFAIILVFSFLLSCSKDFKKISGEELEFVSSESSISLSGESENHTFEQVVTTEKKDFNLTEIEELKSKESPIVVVERPSPEVQKVLEKEKDIIKNQQKPLKLEGDKKMELLLSSTLGTIFYSIVIFVAGALIGAPLWSWVSKKLPWNK